LQSASHEGAEAEQVEATLENPPVLRRRRSAFWSATDFVKDERERSVRGGGLTSFREHSTKKRREEAKAPAGDKVADVRHI